MDGVCPNLPEGAAEREREREHQGPRAVSPSLIIAATIMTAGTELIWRRQPAIGALQWLRCGYHYVINTFHSPLVAGCRAAFGLQQSLDMGIAAVD